jgi:CheY-like chemotaxis protein
MSHERATILLSASYGQGPSVGNARPLQRFGSRYIALNRTFGPDARLYENRSYPYHPVGIVEMTARHPDVQSRLMAMFRQEAEEHLSALTQGLQALDRALPAEEVREAIEDVFRAVHTLRGAARSVGLRDFEAGCQGLETVLARLKSGHTPLTRDVLALLQEGAADVARLVAQHDAPAPRHDARQPCTRVLVVDDSEITREYLCALLEQEDGLEVAGTARDGAEAVEQARSLRPDVILMDVHLPHMDGLEATRRIMAESPAPIILATAGLAADEAGLGLEAIRAGALKMIDKPGGFDSPEARELVRTVKLAARG